jgi:inner membrane protein
MDNLTHSLVGLALSKSGLERLSPYATAVCILGANAPDADIVALIAGRWFYLEHHRGITHSIVGIIVLSIAIPLLFWLGDGAIAAWRKREPQAKLGGLLLASFIATASHPIMDWTNNYGIRPFLPFNNKWYYGDLVFIMDPWLWLVLGGACFWLTAKTKGNFFIWSLIGIITTLLLFFGPTLRQIFFGTSARSNIQIPRSSQVLWAICIISIIALYRSSLVQRWGNKIALAALAFVVLYWSGLWILHKEALRRVEGIASLESKHTGDEIKRVAAMPTVANPFRWQAMIETDKEVRRFDLLVYRKWKNQIDGSSMIYEKPFDRDAEVVAKVSREDPNVKVFLDFARFPVTKIEGDCLTELLVQFADLRYTEPTRASAGNFSISVPVDCDNVK